MPLDGNPIFHARSRELARAIRIIQGRPERESVELAAWVDTFDFADAGGPGFTEELVLNLAASEEAVSIVRDLIKRWMDLSVSRERMEDIVRQLDSSA